MHLVRMNIEMLVAKGRKPRQHGVDLDLAGDEGVEGLGVLGGAGHPNSPWFVTPYRLCRARLSRQ